MEKIKTLYMLPVSELVFGGAQRTKHIFIVCNCWCCIVHTRRCLFLCKCAFVGPVTSNCHYDLLSYRMYICSYSIKLILTAIENLPRRATIESPCMLSICFFSVEDKLS